MSFIEEIRSLANTRHDNEESIINDIITYFEKQWNSDKFEEKLKENYIKKAINKGERTCKLKIEFWDYHEGCSNTYISVSGCRSFELEGDDYDSKHKFKGIELVDIHKKICFKLSNLYKKKLENLELSICYSKRLDEETRFKYFEEEIVVKW